MEHGDDGRSRDDVMDGPASPPDEPGRILDPFRKAFVWTRTRLNLSGEIFGTPQCPVARILAPVLTVLGASILVCDLFESPWREVLAFAALAAALFSVGYRPHPLDALRRPGKPMRWFLCLGCVLVLPVVTFYIYRHCWFPSYPTRRRTRVSPRRTRSASMWSCSSRSWARRACRFFCSRCCIRPSIGHGAGRIHGSVPSSRGWFRPFCSACCICLRIDGIFCNAWSSSSRCSWDSPRSSRRAAGPFCSFPISCTTCSAGPWC